MIYQEGKKKEYPKDLAKAAKWFELAGTTTNYTVASGESRWQINVRFGIPLEVIRAANPEVDMNRIKGGEKIIIPGARIAQFNLGMLYEQGKGVKKDHASTAEWHTLAAKAGLADAQFALGYLLEKGTASGTIVDTPDFVGAVHWYSRSANQGFGPGATKPCSTAHERTGHRAEPSAGVQMVCPRGTQCQGIPDVTQHEGAV